MNILAIDTATGSCSAAIAIGGKLVATQFDAGEGRQSRVLLPLIERAMAEAGLKYKDLQKIISTVGPGSFTGLRIGLSAARALAFGAGIPIRGITTLSALALAAKDAGAKGEIVSVLNAGKGEVYYQWFTRDACATTEPLVGKIEVIHEHKSAFTAVGNMTDALKDAPQAYVLEKITHPLAEYFALAPENSLIDAYPFYIRPPDAKLPKSAAG